MTFYDTVFGYWGLPLMIAFASGIIFNLWVGITCLSIWVLMWSYSFIKFGGNPNVRRK